MARRDNRHFIIYGLPSSGDDDQVVSFEDANFGVYLKTFFRGTTLQGFPQMIKGPGIIRKVFWMLCIMLSAFGLGWELWIFVTKIKQWQVTSNVKLVRAEQLYFPAVTLCSSNAVNVFYDYTLTELATQCSSSSGQQQTTASAQQSSGGQPQGQGNSQQPQNGPPGRKKRQAQPPPPKNMATLMGNVTDGVASIYAVMENLSTIAPGKLQSAGLQLCDVILDCAYNAQPCDIQKAFHTWHWNWVYGNCWTFNPGYTKDESPSPSGANIWQYKTGQPNNDDGVKKATINGDTYGLKLLLYTDDKHYSTTATGSGWKVVVHNQTEMPFPENEGVFVMPGTSTRIGIEMKTYKQLGTIDHVIYSAPYSKCIDAMSLSRDETDKRTAYTTIFDVGYSKLGCQKTCYQQNVMKYCNCFDYYYPKSGPAFTITANRPCSYYNSTQWYCKQSISSLYSRDALNCSCPETCTTYSYDMTISTLKWPSVDMKLAIASCNKVYKKLYDVATKQAQCSGESLISNDYENCHQTDDTIKSMETCINGGGNQDVNDIVGNVIGSRFAEVYIYYQTFDYQATTESELWQVADIIAYFGGIVGLFFGFTMITVCEFVVLGFDLLGIAICHIYRSFRPSTKRNSISSIPTRASVSRVSHGGTSFDSQTYSHIKSSYELAASSRNPAWNHLHPTISSDTRYDGRVDAKHFQGHF